MPEGIQIGLRRDNTGCQDRLGLRRKEEALTLLMIKQRLLAQVVLCQEKAAVALVPNRESEHAAQMVDAIGAVVPVEMKDHLDVGLGGEDVAAGRELTPQLRRIIDLAIADQSRSLRVSVIGWAPPSMSMMLKRLCPRDTEASW